MHHRKISSLRITHEVILVYSLVFVLSYLIRSLISLFLLTATSVTVVFVVTSISTTSAFRNVDLYWGHQCIAVSEGVLNFKSQFLCPFNFFD